MREGAREAVLDAQTETGSQLDLQVLLLEGKGALSEARFQHPVLP